MDDDPADDLEQERARLAAQIQSALLDPLSLLLSQAMAYEHSFTPEPSARAAMQVITALARQALQQARDLEASLLPAGLHSLGLATALELLAGRAERALAVRLVLAPAQAVPRLPARVELALFRLVQDALDRAALARARHVRVALAVSSEGMRLRVSDDGDPAVRSLLQERQMRRLQRLGIQVTSDQGAHGGLELACTLPLGAAARLTAREQQILSLLAEGLSNKAIAARLALSPRTVNFHLDNIYAKLGVHSRIEAVRATLQNIQ